VAEGARLESVYTFTGIGGSNPSLSATLFILFIFPEELSKLANTTSGWREQIQIDSSRCRWKMGFPIRTGVEMSEPELRAALAMNGRTEAEISQVIDAARDQAV
jgi:hypothetical protein